MWFRIDGNGDTSQAPEYQIPAYVAWSLETLHPMSAVNTVHYLNRIGRSPHIVWSPSNGLVLNGVEPDRVATYLRQELRWGAIQVVVVARDGVPFTSIPLVGAEKLLETFRRWGVPDAWPLGPPSSVVAHSAVRRPSEAGHYSADQLDPDAKGIGAIDVRRLFSE